jgi:peptide/nickel transport system substrate-binding protein
MDQNQRDLLRLLNSVKGKDLTRRELVKRGAAIGLGSYAFASALGTVVGPQQAQARALRSLLQDDPAAGTYGGTLRVAIIGEPPTLDEHQTTAGITAEIGYCMYETLMSYNEEYEPVPMLAESHSVSDDGLTHTFALRQGVMFHNGEEMTSADVKASLDRWGEISGVGQRLYAVTESVDATDDYTITWNLTQPYGTILVALANNTQAAVIYPQSVIEEGTLEPNEAHIGTGPYRMVQWQPDAFIRFERFEDYAAVEGGPVGYAGTKYAYVDQIEFIPVPDISARVAGLQAGDYDMHNQAALTNDQYDILADYPGLVTQIETPTEWPVIFLNWESEWTSNLALREAIQASLNLEALLQSAYGSPDFYRLDPGLMMQQTRWWTDAGSDRYNMYDPDLARAKLEEAGYDGTPLRFMSTQEYGYMFATSTPAVQMMEEVGLVIDHQVIDWATVVERRAQPEEWELFVTGHGFVPDPSQISYVGQMNQYPGWWSSEESLDLAAQLLAEGDFDTAYGIWEQIQSNAYTEIPAIKTGDGATTSSRSDRIGGWSEQHERGFKYWNLGRREETRQLGGGGGVSPPTILAKLDSEQSQWRLISCDAC